MTANDSKSYFPYLNKLVDEYNNTYHHSINKKLINPYYSALTEDTESNPKAPKFKVNDRVWINKYKNVFSKSYTGNWKKTFPFKWKKNNMKFSWKRILAEYVINELLSRTK